MPCVSDNEPDEVKRRYATAIKQLIYKQMKNQLLIILWDAVLEIVPKDSGGFDEGRSDEALMAFLEYPGKNIGKQNGKVTKAASQQTAADVGQLFV